MHRENDKGKIARKQEQVNASDVGTLMALVARLILRVTSLPHLYDV